MKTRVYRLYGQATATTNSLAQLDIRAPGIITAVRIALSVPSLPNGLQAQAEVSFSSQNLVLTNDPLGPIAMVEVCNLLTTSGAVMTVRDSFISNIAIPVDPSNRLYLHLLTDSGATHRLWAALFVAER